MTYNALALFVRAAIFGQRGNEQSTQDLRNGTMRAGAGLRRSAPDDLEMAEDDYYRFAHAPRDYRCVACGIGLCLGHETPHAQLRTVPALARHGARRRLVRYR
jgi:hypothetical protein